MSLTLDKTTMKGFVIFSHPYVFDATFVVGTRATQWTGSGHVVFHASGGGVNNAWALVEADDEGYAGLKKAGFQVHSANKGRYVTSSGDTYVVEEDGGLVRRELGSGKKLLD